MVEYRQNNPNTGGNKEDKTKDIQITNDMQIVLAKFFHPEVKNKEGCDKALCDVLPRDAKNFRILMDEDTAINPHNRLLDLWNSDRAHDAHKVIPFVAGILESLRETDKTRKKLLAFQKKDLLEKFDQETKNDLFEILKSRVGIL